MFIPDPDFYPSRIPDPKTATKERGEKNLLSYFFFSHKFHKIVNYFIFELLKNKIWSNFQRFRELFIQIIVTKLSKIWFWDPGSGKNQSRIPDQGSKMHRIPDPDPQQSFTVLSLVASLASKGSLVSKLCLL